MSKGDDTRRRIIENAAAIFNQHGFAGASMSELMGATGLKKGGIYRHFSSKEQLAAEAFDYAWRAATDARMHDLAEVPNSVDKLRRFIANFIERRPAVPGGCPALNTGVEADDGNPLLRGRALKAFREWRKRLAVIIAGGIKKREIRQGVDPKALATLIISSLEGALAISRLEKRQHALTSVRRYLERYLETAVRSGTYRSQ
jgi:TetR/AcrR family transcriptional repressor of nem operon